MKFFLEIREIVLIKGVLLKIIFIKLIEEDW